MTEDLAETNTNPNPKRSHTGCVRCKRRRQRCDEKKPQCGRCIAANITCEYAVTLRWGGRDFGRSRFGQCMKGNNNLSKLEHATNGFVYTFSAPSRKPKHAMLSHLPPEIQYLSYLSLAERGLFYHFRDEASRVTSCHSHVQTELCELILPMAIESQALMYATLAWAAMHSVERRGTIDHVSDPNTCIAHLKMRSIENLRIELRNPTPENIYALLATVRTLTQCEIHSGSDGESVWRVHIEGAKALMAAVKELRSIGRIGVFDSRTQPRLLYRWFDSLDSLAALTSAGNYIQPAEPSTGSTRDEDPACDVYLDNYNGFYTDLSILLGKIGVASRAWRNQKLDGCDPAPIRAQADHFEQEVHAMMERDQQSPLKFYPGVLEKLSPQAILEYSLCNETYQHTALIHINRRLRDLPGNNPVIQDSVKKIIECTKKIAPATGSSPLIVMATPLFTAGCEAYDQERDDVRELLVQLYENLKIRNVKLSLQILEAYWARDTKEGDWDDIFRQNNSDFIPY